MVFGMPTLIETDTLEECAILCRSLNLDFIELNMNLPQYQLAEIDISHFQDIADRYDISYTIHLDENLNVSDFNPYIAEGYRRTVAETIALAKKLGIPVINMHMSRGIYFTLPDRKVYLFSQYRDRYLKSLTDFRQLCEAEIGMDDITICIENCDGFLPFQKEALSILLESRVFGLTFDIGHNHGCGGADEPYILENERYLCHMHMHDALGGKNHLALGMGELDLEKYCALAEEHNCRIVLETKTVEGLRQSVNWICRRGYTTLYYKGRQRGDKHGSEK
ncbi:MAG: sugar phosphate isomerase/epimerase [Lachnospiraceae bacterium]|nr:sugar phosphate isomerase/epimerase [Lachnospiraceae bacterium]